MTHWGKIFYTKEFYPNFFSLIEDSLLAVFGFFFKENYEIFMDDSQTTNKK